MASENNVSYRHLVLQFLVLLALAITFFQVAGALGDVKAYRQKRDGVKPIDAEKMIKLAEWAVNEHGYVEEPDKTDVAVLEEVADDLETVLKEVKKKGGDPTGLEIQLKIVKSTITKMKAKIAGGTGVDWTGGEGGAGKKKEKKFLDDEDIQWIRLVELSKKDVGKVKIRFKNDVIERYLELMRRGNHPDWDEKDFKDKQYSDVERVLEIRNRMPGNNEFLKDIHIEKDPVFMTAFEKDVWPAVKEGCASLACHGGAKGKGRLRLVTGPPSKNAKGMYTNFAILSGFIGPGQHRMIQRMGVDESLLLQYGLNSKFRSIDHPKLPNEKTPPPIFESKSEKKYLRIKSWIENLESFPPHPDYRIDIDHLYGNPVTLHTITAQVPD